MKHYKNTVCFERVINMPLRLVLDFDGTLTPLVSNRDDVFIPSSLLCLLVQLSLKVKIGIISGRALSDLMPRIPFQYDFVIGNHGFESFLLSSSIQEKICERMRIVEQRLLYSIPKNQVENKGSSVAVHIIQA